MDMGQTQRIPDTALADYGETLARQLQLEGTLSARRVVREYRAHLSRLRRQCERFQARGAAPGSTGEWLADNWYLAQREGLAACEALAGSGRLRASRGESALAVLCRGLVQAGDGAVDRRRCRLFLDGVQRYCILTRRELEQFMPVLRCAMVEALERESREPERLGAAGRVERLITALRLFSTLDMRGTLEAVDRAEQLLRRDPAGVYRGMDEATRAQYRRQVERLAKRCCMPEYQVARRALELSAQGETEETRHVGWWLFVQPLGEKPPVCFGNLYMYGCLALTLLLCALAGFFLGTVWASVLLILPLSQAVKCLADFLVLRLTPPRRLPRLALERGVPPEGRTLCVVSALLTDEAALADAARRLEEYRLANRDAGAELLFGLLADLPESRDDPAPRSRALLERGTAVLRGLNEKYGGFYFLVRESRYDAVDRVYRGWERKRGALLELSRLIRGLPGSVACLAGDADALRGVQYILTLDGDTRLLPGTAKELIGTMLHPLNRPVVDPRRRVVVRGHGILQPKMAVELAAADKCDFTRLFAGQGGTDPYGSLAGELYMNLWGWGIFSGKGILDVAAFAQCLEGEIPQRTVLSHDILEGAYLRCGYAGDVELSDGFPGSAPAYYRRLHRWIRGDWQNLPWLFSRGRKLAPADRWKLLDNLRRSLTAPGTFLAIFFGLLLGGRALSWVAAAAGLSFISQLLLELAGNAFRREEEMRVRYHSQLLHGFCGSLMQTAVKLLLLPWEAWVSLSAAAVALWRMAVSRREMLAWQTAAQAETGRGSLVGQCWREMWPVVVPALLALLLSRTILGRCAGLLWLLSPFAAAALSRPRAENQTPPQEDRAYLTACAGEIWGYFRRFSTAECHFLPPDNFQAQPPVGPAARTSPTNLGLGLMSCLNALDLGLEKPDSIFSLLENMLSTMEKLEKWKGHFYNWYDTRTLAPLSPRYVSTVDSGNLCASLLALSSGLREYGRQDLARRAEAMEQAMEFAPLYDEKRRLFRIGRNIDTGRFDAGCYDLLASEARLTAYVAIARGDVDRRHWRRLSRAQVSLDGYRGMASWTGSMFEYLMPELFLPCRRNSLLYESARFCLFAQKRRVPPGKPWGISESAYCALDGNLNYRYKAHGCASLALKRGMDQELVLSPYSSFLALGLDRRGAVRNLKRMEKLEMRGPWGFWEALDCTPGRCGRRPQPVRCVMSHHLGMSMLSIANCLLDQRNVKRFLAHPAMAAYRSLLEERVPMGGILLRRREEQGERRPRRPGLGQTPWSLAGDNRPGEAPASCVLSNGAYSIMLTSQGLCAARCSGVLPYRAPEHPQDLDGGLRLYWEAEGQRELLFPFSDLENIKTSFAFSGENALFSRRETAIELDLAVSVSASLPGELRRLSLRTARSTQGELVAELEPVLAKEEDYGNHKSFWRLGREIQALDGAVTVFRLPRGQQRARYLALAADRPIHVPQACQGWQVDGPLRAAIPLALPAGETVQLRLSLCMGDTAAEALQGARLCLGPETGSTLPEISARLYAMDAGEVGAAMSWLPYLWFPRPGDAAASGRCAPGRDGLWRLGLSGDLPLAVFSAEADTCLPLCRKLLGRHALLRNCGVKCDLVLCTGESGAYLQPRSTALQGLLRKLDLEASLGARGGVHILSCGLEDALLAAPGLLLDAQGRPQGTPEPMGRLESRFAPAQRRETPRHHLLPEGEVVFEATDSLPVRAWSNVLTNGHLSFLATDAGTGHLWYENARECPLTPWENEPLAVRGPETLAWCFDGAEHSLFACPGDGESRVCYGPGLARWERRWGARRAEVTAFIPMEGAVRHLLIRTEGGEGTILWRVSASLAQGMDGRCVQVEYAGGVCVARNPRCIFPELNFFAWGSRPGENAGTAGSVMALSFPAGGELVLSSGCGQGEACSPQAAHRALEETRAFWREKLGRIQISSPLPALDAMVNTWAPYAALSCRLLARSSLYQSGGALGFRDQLQDAVNLLPLDPALARESIRNACRHQFVEGDVLHWWHVLPGGDRGVRTRCSDDLLWLPWALGEYVRSRGETRLLEETLPFLEGPPLSAGEADRYDRFPESRETASILEHGRRALDLALARERGPGGLMAFGSGDWNDGMDRVGGESVWLTWFAAAVCRSFASLAGEDGQRYLKEAAALTAAAEGAWDGQWYLRGRFADGSPLGGAENPACRLDSLSQSFAALCPGADPEHVRQALDAAVEQLFLRPHSIVQLFTPPFSGVGPDPGYIQSYGPGFRENGGQYTHAAIWLAMACLLRGRTKDGEAILLSLLPKGRETPAYEGEPYVLAADVYTAPGHLGQAGWTWYTGSAGWYWRVCLEQLLGLSLRGGKLCLRPRLPEGWESWSARLRGADGTAHELTVTRRGAALDGEAMPEAGLPW